MSFPHHPAGHPHGGAGSFEPSSDRPTASAPAAPVVPGGPVAGGLRWAWNALLRNAAAFLVPALVYSVIVIVALVAFVIIGVMAAMTASSPTPGVAAEQPISTAGGVLLTVVLGLVVALWTSGILRAGTVILAGRRPTLKEGFLGNGTTIAVALLVALLGGVLGQLAQGVSVLFYLPLVAVSLLLYFAAAEAAHGAGFGEALTNAASLAVKNLGTVVVTALLALVLGLAMVIPLLALAVIPLMQLLVLGVHQRVSGNALVEPAAA